MDMAYSMDIKLPRRFFPGLFAAMLIYFIGFMALVQFFGAQDTAQRSDVIIVLGAGLRRDGRPSSTLTKRSQHGAALWKSGLAERVVCTGGQAKTYPRSEAEACREVLLRNGVPAAAIILEDRSRSTEENAIFSKSLMDGLGLKSAVLVSDSYHMLRANWLFQRQGIQISRSSVPASRANYLMLYPYALREFGAIHWQALKDALGLPLTHLPGI